MKSLDSKNRSSKQRRRKVRNRVISILTAAVVFATTYALVLPAITMDAETAAAEPGIDVAQPAAESIEAVPVAAEPAAPAEAAPAEQAAPAEAAPAEQAAPAEAVTAPAAETAPAEETAAPAETPAEVTADSSAPAETPSGEVTPAPEPVSSESVAAESSAEGGEAADPAAEEEKTDGAEEEKSEEEKEETEDEEKEEEKKLAVSPFTYDGGEYLVTVSFDDSAAIPEGSTLAFREYGAGSMEYNAYHAILNQKLIEDGITEEDLNSAVSALRLFEVSFLDKDGAVIRPAAPVNVLIEYRTPTNTFTDESLYALTFRTDDGQPAKATLLTTNAIDGSAGVEAAGGVIQKLRVQGLALNDTHTNNVIGQLALNQAAEAEEETEETEEENGDTEEKCITAQYLTADGAAYNITMTYGPEAGIPEDASLAVSEIVETTDVYEEYVNKTEEALDPAEKVVFARFFDIKIINDADGSEVQPNGAVNVKIELADALTEEIKVVHFEHSDAADPADAINTPEVLASENVEAETLNNAVGFEADSFSIFGIVGTEVITSPGDYIFEGDGFTVKINVSEEANIPSGTELIVSEIDPKTDDYIQHLGQAWSEINKEYLEVKEIRKDIPEDLDLSQYDMDIRPVSINDARFFDIRFVYEEKEIEPDVPVTVEISYDEGLKSSEESVTGVAHYAKDGIEIIDDVETVVEDGEIVSFKYEQESFSDTGTYVGQETSDEEGVVGNYGVSIEYANYDNLLTETEVAELKRAAETKDVGTTLKAAGLNAPATDKNLISNEDGSYTLALSVTGAAQSSSSTNVTKSNVIIVMDRSNSMNSDVEEYTVYTGTYQQGVTYYGYYEKRNEYRELSYSGGQWYMTQQGRETLYSGAVYTAKKSDRLTEEQAALDTVVGTLLAQNKNETTADGTSLADIIEIKVISFATGRSDESHNGGDDWSGNTESGWSTDKATLMGYVNNDSTASGTNWEEAMQYALKVANEKKAEQKDEQVYVIFLTDGGPTTHKGDYTVNTTYATERAYADDDAKAIVDAGHILYGIFTYGTDSQKTQLSTLINNAYNDTSASATYYFDASDTSGLTSALQSIVQNITNSVGYTNVDLTDGVTEMTSTNLKTSTDGSITGLKYYRSGGTDSEGNEKYNSAANNGLGEEWTDAPAATINSDGEVEWDLDDMVLEDGVTYTLTFVVWPSQESVDLVADLNNHKITYDELTTAQKAQIMVSGGMYVLKTNTDYPTVTYSTITTTTINGETTTTTSDPVTANITNPDPIGLSEARMTVEKKWDDSLDPSQREEVEGSVVLDLTMDTALYLEDIEISDETDWKLPEAVCIAPGLMVTSDSPAYDPNATHVTYDGVTYAVLETGHDYIFSEEDINSHFELTAYSHHPMLVNGTLTYVTFTYDNAGNITGVSDMYEAATLSATNTIKGGFNVSKKVVDLDGNEIESSDPFTVTVNLTDAGGNALPAKTTSDGTSYNYDYRYYYGINNPAYVECADQWDEDGNITRSRSGHIYGTGTSFELTIYPGDVVRVVNVESGALYYVTETLDSSSKYTLQSIDYTIQVGDGSATSYDESDVGETKTKDDGTTWYSIEGNSASSTVVTNKIPVADIGLLKIGDGQTSNPLADVTFELYSTYDAENPENNVKAKDSSGNEITTITTDEEGLATVGKLLAGTYYLVETNTNDGYNLLATPVTITINKTDTGLTVSYHQDDNSSSDTGPITPTDGIYRLTIDNKSGVELPMTGGSGTLPYTLGGLMLVIASALMYGFRLRRRERRSH